MAGPKICRYFDIPFQHADPGLDQGHEAGPRRRPGPAPPRPHPDEAPRRRRPDLAHRRLSGRGRRNSPALRRFVEAARFDHLGVFAYSPERGTASFSLPDPRPGRGEGGAPPRDHGDPGARSPARRIAALVGRTVETSSSRAPDAGEARPLDGPRPFPGPGGRRDHPFLPAAPG
ncbi:MAG: hypothetical protein M0C28_23725 [Candidatus Moduliflexus flocculans]|nr:hypothetical protein [Candidatus Moduliflexus flocculans]